MPEVENEQNDLDFARQIFPRMADAGNVISKTLDFKIFQGSMPLGPSRFV
jgi:hypothetical protein